MRRGIAVFVSMLAWLSACGSFGEGATGDPPDASGAGDGSVVDGGDVPESSIVEAAPADGNPCSSRAAKFAAGDFFQNASTEGFDFPQMTVEAWIYVPASSASKSMHIVSHARADQTSGWALALTPGPNLVFHSYVNGEEQSLGGSAASSVATNRWVHVAATRTGTQVQLVIDGNTSAPFSNTFKFGATTTAANFTVGASSLDGSQAFEGLIEEVRLSDVVRTISVARKTSEPDANTVALWRFDEQGSDAIDSSSNGKDLGEEGKVLRVCMPRFADQDVVP